MPGADATLVRELVAFLATRDYVGALFVDERFGTLPGALGLRAIGLAGSARLPSPAVVVAFRTWNPSTAGKATDDPAALLDAVEIADTSYQQGQGNHGSFGRDNTFNFLAATGPDFRRAFRDPAPAGNADIAPTIANILGLAWPAGGDWRGRVLAEALRTAAPLPAAQRCAALSAPAPDGRRTVLEFQRVDSALYLDSADFRPARPGEQTRCR